MSNRKICKHCGLFIYFRWSLVDCQQQDYKNLQYAYVSLLIYASKEVKIIF